MTVSELVAELNTLGYKLYAEGGKVKFRHLLEGDPPAEKAKPLFLEVRACKEEVIVYLQGESFEAFDPDDLLIEAIEEEAQAGGWTDENFLDLVGILLAEGVLKEPWGFKVRGSPLIGSDYWIISDDSARGRIPAGAMSFTLGELRPIVEASKILGGRVVKVIRHKEKEAVNV